MRNLALHCVLLCALQTVDGGVKTGVDSGVETRVKTGVKMELPPVEVRSVIQGVYEVRKSGGEVGREDFVRTTMSNNTVTYESVFEAMEEAGTAVSGNNKLEVEEDSGFPRSYYTYRRTRGTGGETVREVSVRMVANVAVVSEHQGSDEKTRRLVLPAGCLFVEGNIAHHLSLVLNRYDRDAGGKQVFRAFDPLGVGTTDVSLEFVGETALVDSSRTRGTGAPAKTASRYRYFTGGAFTADVFADMEGNITRIDATPADLVYILVSVANRTGSVSPSK